MKAPVADGPLLRLTDISRALTYARSLDEVLELTVGCAVDLLDADRAVLMLDDDQDGMLRIAAGRGVSEEVMTRFREPLDENLLTRLSGVLEMEDPERFVGVPLVVRGGVIGLLGVRRPSSPTVALPDEEWLLSALADQAAVAIESARDQRLRAELAGRVGRMERERIGKDHAIQVMSHDLRTPLNAIQGYASLLSGGLLGPVTDRQADALRRMKSVGKHLEVLLDNVLEMVRVESGSLELHLVPVDLERVADEALQMVAIAAERSSIALAMGAVEPVQVTADAGRVRQVIVQLIENAVKYSLDGGNVTVDVRVGREGDDEWGEVSVSDVGPGVPPELRERIFEPYLRSDGATARSRTGVGLGLAIARGLTEQMKGRIVLESEVGRGSVFTVRLPLVPRAAPP